MRDKKKNFKKDSAKTARKVTEKLIHFNCGLCSKWWSIGDAPKIKKKWFCPWCGEGQEI